MTQIIFLFSFLLIFFYLFIFNHLHAILNSCINFLNSVSCILTYILNIYSFWNNNTLRTEILHDRKTAILCLILIFLLFSSLYDIRKNSNSYFEYNSKRYSNGIINTKYTIGIIKLTKVLITFNSLYSFIPIFTVSYSI